MAADSYGFLDTPEEDLLHTSRLLPIEQKTFQRISRRLLQRDSLVSKRSSHLPSPPPDSAEDEAAEKVAARERQANFRKQWREDFMLDFGALESSMVRIQLLHNSNVRERRRYADEKVKIVGSAEAIKNNTAELRAQLEEARSTMKLRKTYDALAETILKNQTLKSRDDQEEFMRKTNAEIAEEDRKSREYEERWAKRHEQFNRIIEECNALQNLIKEEKEEAARKQGMEGGDDEDAGQTSTPDTPAPDTRDATPMLNDDGEGLKPLPAGSKVASRAPSPGRNDFNDISIGEAVATPATHSSLEEGEEGEASETNTPMEQ